MVGPLIIFRIEDQHFALPSAAVRECVPLPHLRRPPAAPQVVAGFFNLGAERIAAIDLGELLACERQDGHSARDSLYRVLILLAHSPVAFLVDGVVDVRRSAGTSLREPEMDAPKWLEAIFESGGKDVWLLRPNVLVGYQSQQRLAHLAQIDAQRDAKWDLMDV